MPFRENHVNTAEAKNRLNELIAQVNETKQPIIVEKRGEAVAVVLDYGSYLKKVHPSQKKSVKKDDIISDLQSFHRRLRKKYPQGTGDAVELLAKIRGERLES